MKKVSIHFSYMSRFHAIPWQWLKGYLSLLWILRHALLIISQPSAGRSSCHLPWGSSRFSKCLPHLMKPPLVVEVYGYYTFWANWFFVFLVGFFRFFLTSPSHMEISCLHTYNCSASFLLDVYYLCFLLLCPFSHMLFHMKPLAQHNLNPLCCFFTNYLYSSRV